jgi:hypothetical protein
MVKIRIETWEVEQMSRIRPTQRIIDVVKDIKDDRYRLPSIQRSFVWKEERICKLMDSLMNDYPIGSFLVWKPGTELSIRTRKFIQDHKMGEKMTSDDEVLEPMPYLVLDGKRLYFKIDSNPDEEEDDLRYVFSFLTSEQTKGNPHWVRPSDILKLGIEEIPEHVDGNFGDDDGETRKMIGKNLGIFIRIFAVNENISIQEVKEDLPYNDILEVFVRVNSGGIVLTKSDLLFSTVILLSPEMEKNYIDIVDELNGNGEYEFDTDFLIKCSFVLLNQGAKYDIKKLRNGKFIAKLEADFDKIKRALFSTVEFLKTDAKILSKRFLKSDLALIPIVDFVFRQPHQHLPEGQTWKLRQYLYMSFLMKFYSYGPDGKLDVIHKKITDYKDSAVFPIKRISKYIEERTGMEYRMSRNMLYNLDLVLNMVQGGVFEIPKKRGWSLERDHIFPRSLVERKGFPDELIDSIGNFRYINKTRNILKRDHMPEEDTDFYGSDDSELRRLFLEARNSLTETTFRNFVEKREELIENEVKEFLAFDK